MQNPSEYLIKKVKDDLAEIRARRGDFSLRSYARRIGLEAPVLSEILSGKRKISYKIAEKIISAINIEADKSQEILGMFPKKQNRKKTDVPSRLNIPDYQFEMISDYWYFAILYLTELPDCPNDPEWIAAKLGISVNKAVSALEVLLTENYIEIVEGKLKNRHKRFVTTNDIPSSAIRKNHAQGIDLAREALFSMDVNEREYQSLTMSVKRHQMPEFKTFVRKFIREFEERFQTEEPDDVCRLQVQLFPLTKTLDH